MRIDAPPAADDDLGPAGEEEWRRLRRQIDLAPGFWLGFVLTDSPPVAAALRGRVEQVYRVRKRRLRAVLPASPDELRALPGRLLDPDFAELGCTWIEETTVDPGGRAGPWQAAWSDVLVQLNRGRDAIRRHMRGGLVLCAPPPIKTLARDLASDLWSVRGIVVDVSHVAPVVAPGVSPASAPGYGGGYSTGGHGSGSYGSGSYGTQRGADDTLAPQAIAPAANKPAQQAASRAPDNVANRARTLVDRGADKRAIAAQLLDVANDLVDTGSPREATEALNVALDLIDEESDTGPRDYAALFAAKARAEEAEGSLAAAEDHIRQAIELKWSIGQTVPSVWVWQSANLARLRGDHADAEHRVLGHLGTGAGSLSDRDRAVMLDLLAEIRRDAGKLAEAGEALAEAVEIHRRLLRERGENAAGLADLSGAVKRLGDLRKQTGELSQAAAAYEEAIAIDRRRCQLGDAAGPDAERDLALALGRASEMRAAAGDRAGAALALDEALALQRALRARRGDSEETLRDLTVSLDKLGEHRRDAGDLAGAERAFAEALELSRRLHHVAKSRLSLRDVAHFLIRIGHVREKLDEHEAAAGAFEEALALRREEREVVGETPETLRDLSLALLVAAEARVHRGDRAGGLALADEALALRRRLRELVAGAPQAVRDLSYALNLVGVMRRDGDDLAAAGAAFDEALALRRQLHEQLGDAPQTLRDLSVSLDLVGDVARRRGDLAAARAAFEEALALDRTRIERFGESDRGLRDLDRSLRRVVAVRRAAGDEPAAQAAESERAHVAVGLGLLAASDDAELGPTTLGSIPAAADEPTDEDY